MSNLNDNKSDLIQALKDNARMNDEEKNTQYAELEALQDEYNLKLKGLLSKNRRWQRLDIYALIVLIILLLYSLTTVIYITKYVTKKYQVNLVADTITVDESALTTKSTQEILEDSVRNGYVSNCMEFYYDDEDGIVQQISSDDSIYYSVDEMQAQVNSNKLNYTIKSIEKVDKPGTSNTRVANQEFVYGFDDGSSQEAIPNSDKLVWNGYSPVLVQNYMSTVEPYTVTRTPAYIVIDSRVDVTEEFVNAMMKGIIDDTYMNNRVEMTSDTIETDAVEYVTDADDDYFYGLHTEGDEMIYTCSHKIGETALGMQYIRQYSILGALEKNIEDYLGKDVTLTTYVPKVTNRPLTIIYLATDNYCYDSWYILGNQYQQMAEQFTEETTEGTN